MMLSKKINIFHINYKQMTEYQFIRQTRTPKLPADWSKSYSRNSFSWCVVRGTTFVKNSTVGYIHL